MFVYTFVRLFDYEGCLHEFFNLLAQHSEAENTNKGSAVL